MSIMTWILLFLIVAVLCIAEWLLARCKAWWPGVILPVMMLLPAWFVLPNLLLNALSLAENAGQMLSALLVVPLCLLPTLVLLAIYWFCRRRRKSREQVEKMKIQDL